MKCLLCYYTGTFNTRYLTKLLKQRFEGLGFEVDSYEIDPLKKVKIDMSQYGLVGLGYPIYGFNVPRPFVKFVKGQEFVKGQKVFIYKDSGETYHANDASSVALYKKLTRDKASIRNEYHFVMPYNIHFRFDDALVKEMLGFDDLLIDVLAYEVTHDIPNIKRYKMIHRFVTFFVKLQYIGGPINSYFYRVDRSKCSKCGLCIKNCPTKNILLNDKGRIVFNHRCLMCMRCSLFCPNDAIEIGLFKKWKVNGPYNLDKIRKMESGGRVITNETKGFFKCYIETYESIRRRHAELFGG